MLAEVFVTLFLFVAIIMVTALLFGGWVIFMIIRLIVRALAAIFGVSRPRAQITMPLQSPMVTCSNQRCRGPNPISARFCRRCGVALPSPQHVAARRAAMW
jgi:hypothetical protein